MGRRELDRRPVSGRPPKERAAGPQRAGATGGHISSGREWIIVPGHAERVISAGLAAIAGGVR